MVGAGFDQDVARAFSDGGVPAVALDSLKYFWTKRAPAESARVVARILKDDREAPCPNLPIGVATVVEIGEGHHLGGQAGTIVERIRQFSATAVANQRMSSLRGLPAISVVTSMSTRGSASPPGEAR